MTITATMLRLLPHLVFRLLSAGPNSALTEELWFDALDDLEFSSNHPTHDEDEFT